MENNEELKAEVTEDNSGVESEQETQIHKTTAVKIAAKRESFLLKGG